MFTIHASRNEAYDIDNRCSFKRFWEKPKNLFERCQGEAVEMKSLAVSSCVWYIGNRIKCEKKSLSETHEHKLPFTFSKVCNYVHLTSSRAAKTLCAWSLRMEVSFVVLLTLIWGSGRDRSAKPLSAMYQRGLGHDSTLEMGTIVTAMNFEMPYHIHYKKRTFFGS